MKEQDDLTVTHYLAGIVIEAMRLYGEAPRSVALPNRMFERLNDENRKFTKRKAEIITDAKQGVHGIRMNIIGVDLIVYQEVDPLRSVATSLITGSVKPDPGSGIGSEKLIGYKEYDLTAQLAHACITALTLLIIFIGFGINAVWATIPAVIILSTASIIRTKSIKNFLFYMLGTGSALGLLAYKHLL